MTRADAPAIPLTAFDVRQKLNDALELDLVGPWFGHDFMNEQLPGRTRPSLWYLTGFLIPVATPPEQRADEDEDDDFGETPENGGLAEESTEERRASKKTHFPSSMGLSFLVSSECRHIDVVVRWGDYELIELRTEDDKSTQVWQRSPREGAVRISLDDIGNQPKKCDVPDSGGLQLNVVLRSIEADNLEGFLPPDTRSISVFIVNHRVPSERQPDLAYAFQPEIEVETDAEFIARPDLRGLQAEDWDEQVADLHYADTPEYATGHGVSVEWDLADDGCCRTIHTEWIPSAEVEKTVTVPLQRAMLGMEDLAALADGQSAREALQPIVEQYRTWVGEQRSAIGGQRKSRRETAEGLLHFAELAAKRIDAGIALLASDDDALDAFCVANRTVARALRRRLDPDTAPEWRAFQLAFILLNLSPVSNPEDGFRDTVDLLFFPTGGGKTEAYLGLAAFTIVLRRLRNPEDEGRAGAGVSVMMRYTLRLLTLDQLSRAAGLICALELERQERPQRYGVWPFEIGLWVGKAATPNVMGYKGFKGSGDARSKVRQFKDNPRSRPSPIPLENCPWCGTRFNENSFSLLPNDDQPRELRIVCTNFECDFTRDKPLPILAVDEPIYQRLPCFLIATVDKFAALPWVGESGALLGGAERYDAHGFYGAATPCTGRRLAKPLLPPDLIIQDELHLISGPLGTMAGLYEAAIDALCERQLDGRTVRPKIIASTATVRRAQDQIQALFGRAQTQIFPPPGPDRRDSFFARTVGSDESPARLYLGIAAPGRNPKALMRRAWLALMGAAQKAYLDAGGAKNPDNPADAYMTVLGYFTSLRELGGARRILEEEVRNTIKTYGMRKRIGEETGLFRDRKRFSDVVELTSRVSTDKVAQARRQLETQFQDEGQSVDCAIATNMISVGLDIPRLGLMVVLGQPKTHSEYIQATSRVGRSDKRPGLVVTLLNIHKPRDRSHYERFRHYHQTFYRSVEVASVTPFSARALDRGFPGALVALARHSDPAMTPPLGADKINESRSTLQTRLTHVFEERIRNQEMSEEEREERIRSVRARIVELLDGWERGVEKYHSAGGSVQYQKYEKTGPKPLLRDMLEGASEVPELDRFRANRSLRDVEPEVNLFLNSLSGGEVEESS